MMSVRSDAGLPLFPLGERAGALPPSEPELAIAESASSRPVWLHGARAAVFADVRGACREVRMDGECVAADLFIDAGPVANAVVSPGLMRRERLSAAGATGEALLVAPSLPLVVLSWEGQGPSAVELTALPGHDPVRYHKDGNAITLTAGTGGSLLALGCLPGTSAWDIGPAPGGGVRLRCVHPTGLRAIVLAHGSEAAVRTAFSGAKHLAGHAIRAAAGPSSDLLALRTGVPALDDAIGWMQRRLHAGIRHAQWSSARTNGGDASGDAWLWAGIGACSIGDAEAAGLCADALEELGRHDAALLLAARVALATGRSQGLLDRALRRDRTGATALGRLALRTAADALRYAAPADVISGVRAAGETIDLNDASKDPPPTNRSGRRLPTVTTSPSTSGRGSTSEGDLGGALSYLLEGGMANPRPGWSGVRASWKPALEAWTAFTAGEEGAWGLWRSLVARGFEGDDVGVGAWDEFTSAEPPAITGILLAGLGHGWLGARPDAPVGRLGLRPRLPPNVARFRFQGIGVGDARVSLAYARDGLAHRFELTPEVGGVPALVVFETVLGAPELSHVSIDGNPAEVDMTPDQGGTRVRLQTPVDEPRRIEIRAR